MAFFVGLILASAKTIFDHIERHHSINVVFAVVGLLIGVAFVFIVPAAVVPTLWYVLLGGFIAISAMILPGISGSFILLLLGLYEFMLGVVNDFFHNIKYAAMFILGAIAGLFVMSRVISFLFRRDKSKTLYFLLGLVVGGLSVPINGMYGEMSFEVTSLVGHVVLFVLGVAFASVIRNLAKKR